MFVNTIEYKFERSFAMDLLTEILTVLFIAFVFYGVIIGLISIAGISIWGLLKGVHTRNALIITTSIAVLTILYVGINSIGPRIMKESTQVEVDSASKELYISERLFPDNNVAIERVGSNSAASEDISEYYVITEGDETIYIVTLYPEEAFGLMKYKIEYFNYDERLEQ